MNTKASSNPGLLIDTHVHSRHSDGLPSVAEIEGHCARHEIAVALTDHNEIRGAARLLERGKIPVLPGIEVGTVEGLEFLVYFETPSALEAYFVRAVEPGLRKRFMVRSRIDTVSCLEAAQEWGGYVSLAHPFAFGRKSVLRQLTKQGEGYIRRVLHLVDAVECFNGGVTTRANTRAEGYPIEVGKRVTVGSDGHRLASYGSSGVYVTGTMESSSSVLFQQLSTAEDLSFKAGKRRATLPKLCVIAYKHTLYFVVRGNGRKRRCSSSEVPTSTIPR